jgi:hypothetical protein
VAVARRSPAGSGEGMYPHDRAARAEPRDTRVTAARETHLKPTTQPGLTNEMVVLIRLCLRRS